MFYLVGVFIIQILINYIEGCGSNMTNCENSGVYKSIPYITVRAWFIQIPNQIFLILFYVPDLQVIY